MAANIHKLTEKEKETLRLMLRGHDAKSMARQFDLSVHTINERLRNARRKLDVTSSREAARLLYESECGIPEIPGYKGFGDAESQPNDDDRTIENKVASRPYLIGGFVIMLAIAFAAAMFLASHPVDQRPVGDPATALETAQIEQFETVARTWLALVDAGDWDASFAAAGRSFRDPNTITMWRDASLQARVPLGAMIERKALTVDFVQSGKGKGEAEPTDSAIVRFATQFENGSGTVETVTLEQEYGEWKVIGYLIE
ncbi:helix-turn-helix domain-containing protein [Parerythrobacter aestuarii]|uniref:helix-turn-helix domain-containing protein n=1 Tax=Parerythrobacter aestuarii TaxID=3020909 RepID=UPI0024DE1DD0|nr:DUF4019 domain-containing protein [Parerythrobacter aestuarii]